MAQQEALLPGTDAILAGTVEWSLRGGKVLVRYRDPRGYAYRESFDDREAAHAYFLECVARLKVELSGRPKS